MNLRVYFTTSLFTSRGLTPELSRPSRRQFLLNDFLMRLGKSRLGFNPEPSGITQQFIRALARDLSIQQLELAASIPSDICYGSLLLDPFWDPLRGDPRFEKMLASLAPK